jgi:hypothetical protein
MRFDLEFFAGVYRTFGRETTKRMLTIPGGPLVRQAEKNRDEPAEIIAKRDRLAEAALDLLEEYANVDQD